MAGMAVTGEPMPPMPVRRGAWAIYEPFDTADGEQLFLAITSDNQWRRFCGAFARPELLADARLKDNNERVKARAWLLPLVAGMVKPFTKVTTDRHPRRERDPLGAGGAARGPVR